MILVPAYCSVCITVLGEVLCFFLNSPLSSEWGIFLPSVKDSPKHQAGNATDTSRLLQN